MTAELLRLVIAIEVAMVVAALSCLLFTSFRRSRARRRTPLQEAARREIFEVIVADGNVGDAGLDSVKRLGPRERDDVLCSVAAGIRTGEDAAFAEIAAALGTDRRIERGLASRRWWNRLGAVRRLRVLGLDSPRAGALLDDAGPDVRAATALWMSAVRPSADTAARLTGLLSDPDERVRHEVMTALWGMGSSALPALASVAETTDGERRRRAVRVIGMIGDRTQIDALRRLADAGEPALRAEAVLAVGPMLEDGDADFVAGLLRDADATVRRAAVVAAGRAGLLSLAGLVAASLASTDGPTREAAQAALDLLGESGQLLLHHAARTEAVAASG